LCVSDCFVTDTEPISAPIELDASAWVSTGCGTETVENPCETVGLLATESDGPKRFSIGLSVA